MTIPTGIGAESIRDCSRDQAGRFSSRIPGVIRDLFTAIGDLREEVPIRLVP